MKLLVVKLADLGDVLTATPALRALRETFPAAKIDVLTTPPGALALRESPFVDSVLMFDKFAFDRVRGAFGLDRLAGAVALGRSLRSAGYDRVLLLHHLTTTWGTLKYAALLAAIGAPSVGLDNGRGSFLRERDHDAGFGAKHEVEYWLDIVKLIGATTGDTRLAFTIRPDDDATADRLVPDSPFVAIHAGSGGYSVARRWPLDRFVAVAERIRDLGYPVVTVGTERDLAAPIAQAVRGIDLAGKTSVGALAAVLKRARLFVGNDSGVMHIAAAAGAPIVAIFGPSNDAAWGPWTPGGTSRIVRENMGCTPCFYRGTRLGTPEGCPPRTCLDRVTVERVMIAVRALLGGNETE